MSFCVTMSTGSDCDDVRRVASGDRGREEQPAQTPSPLYSAAHGHQTQMVRAYFVGLYMLQGIFDFRATKDIFKATIDTLVLCLKISNIPLGIYMLVRWA